MRYQVLTIGIFLNNGIQVRDAAWEARSHGAAQLSATRLAFDASTTTTIHSFPSPEGIDRTSA